MVVRILPLASIYGVIYYPLVDRETPESIDALFEVLMWRLSLTDEDDDYSIPTY